MTLHLALALAAAAPATTPPPAAPPVAAEAKAGAKAAAKDPMAAMAQVMKMFDKFFPEGPEPDPARLAAARGTAMTMFPNGAYSKAMVGFLDRTAERVLDMSEAELAAMFPETEKEEADKKGKKAAAAKPKKPLSTEPLRVKLARDDPQFDAKYAAIKAFATTMLTKVGTVAEPKLREGMARAMARKFDTAQLGQINSFLATPTGNAYGQQMMGMWFEPDVMRGAFQLFPEMMKMLPEMMGDAAALDAVMKGPKKDSKDKK